MNTYIESELFRDTIIIRMPFPPDPNGQKTESGILMVAGNAEQLWNLRPLEFARQYYQDVYMDNGALDRQYEVPVVGEVYLCSQHDDIIVKNNLKVGDYVTLEHCTLNAIGAKDGYVYFSIPFRALRGKLPKEEALEIFEKYKTGNIFVKAEAENFLAEALQETARKTGITEGLENLSGKVMSSLT